jgi:hypothetical protein
MAENLKDLRSAFMPELLEISDFAMSLGKKPIRSLRTPVKITDVSRDQIQRAKESHARAKMAQAVNGIRLALVALSDGRFEEAGNIAVNAAIEASASFNQNPDMAARIFVTARGIIRNSIRGIVARSV